MIPNIPQSVQAEHKELHKTLSAAEKLSGKTAIIAKRIAAQLHPHFLKEEEFALPPLGLLQKLAKGIVTEDMKPILKLTNKMKAEYQTMLAEHIQIVALLMELSDAARKENHPEVISFAESLMHHAKTEEEVLYPACIIIGDYIRLKLAAKAKTRKKVTL